MDLIIKFFKEEYGLAIIWILFILFVIYGTVSSILKEDLLTYILNTKKRQQNRLLYYSTCKELGISTIDIKSLKSNTLYHFMDNSNKFKNFIVDKYVN